MNKQQITQAIDMFVTGQGNQAGLQGLAEILHALNGETESIVLSNVPFVTTISAVVASDLTAEQAVAAGFTMDVINELKRVAHPTIRFSDMVVTFNAYEVISDELSIWSTIIFDAPDDAVYHCALYLYSDGRILYVVGEMAH